MGGLHKRILPTEAIALGVHGTCIQVHGPYDEDGRPRLGIVNIRGAALASVVDVPDREPDRSGQSNTGHTLAFVDRDGEVTIINVSAGVWRAWEDRETVLPIEEFVEAMWVPCSSYPFDDELLVDDDGVRWVWASPRELVATMKRAGVVGWIEPRRTK
jgi:hypothetical protein